MFLPVRPTSQLFYTEKMTMTYRAFKVKVSRLRRSKCNVFTPIFVFSFIDINFKVAHQQVFLFILSFLIWIPFPQTEFYHCLFIRRVCLYPQKLAITSPTSVGRSVDIVRSWTQTMELKVFKLKSYLAVLLPSSTYGWKYI
jgi:hypothetical protein